MTEGAVFKPDPVYRMQHLDQILGLQPIDYNPMHGAMTIKHRIYLELDRQLGRGATWDRVRATARHLDEKDAVRVMLNRSIGQTDSKNIRSLIRAILQEAGIVDEIAPPYYMSISDGQSLANPDDEATQAEIFKRNKAVIINATVVEFLMELPTEPEIAEGEIATLTVQYVPISEVITIDDRPERPPVISGYIGASGGQRWEVIQPGLAGMGGLSYGTSRVPTDSWQAVMRRIVRDGYRIKLWLSTELTEFYSQTETDEQQ